MQKTFLPFCASPLEEATHFIQAGNKPAIKCQSSSNSSCETSSTNLSIEFFKLSALFLAQVESAGGTDVANLNCTGGRQILLSNRVLERTFFRSGAKGVMPGSTHGFSWLGAREEIKSSFLSGLPPPAQKTPQPTDTD